MAAMEYLCQLIGINSHHLSKPENSILEAELYHRLFEELELIERLKNKAHSIIFKSHYKKENTIVDLQIIRSLINDTLQSGEYTIEGIAYYTQIPIEIIQDLMIKDIECPILSLPRKIIELHKSFRPELYRDLLRKIYLYTTSDHPEEK